MVAALITVVQQHPLHRFGGGGLQQFGNITGFEYAGGEPESKSGGGWVFAAKMFKVELLCLSEQALRQLCIGFVVGCIAITTGDHEVDILHRNGMPLQKTADLFLRSGQARVCKRYAILPVSRNHFPKVPL